MGSLSDEMAILRSLGIIEDACQRLDYLVSYYSIKPVLGILPSIKREIYARQAPFEVKIDSTHYQLLEYEFTITPVDAEHFNLTLELPESQNIATVSSFIDPTQSKLLQISNFTEKFRYDSKILKEAFAFTVIKKEPISQDYSFKLLSKGSLANHYKRSLKITQDPGYQKVLTLSVIGQVVPRDILFLNTLAKVFSDRKIKEREQYYNQSLDFINEQLLALSDSLRNVEDDLELFRKKGRLMNLSDVSGSLLSSLTDIENQKAGILLKKRYFKDLRDYIVNRLDESILVPSLVGVEDAKLESLLSQYMESGIELRKKKSHFKGDNNEEILNSIFPEAEYKRLQKALLEYLSNLEASNDLLLDELEKRIKKYEGQFELLPAKDRALVNIQRKFELNDNIYTLLLSKRMELGITKAGITPEITLLEPAKFFSILSQNTSKTYLLSVIFGIAIPVGVLILMSMLNDRVNSLDEVKRNTSIPVLGSICEYKGVSNLAITNNPKGPVAEMFRSIRLNMGFMLGNEKENKVIAFTSFISGEGKTFSSINYSCILAFAGKKTLLIGADLRKPKIAKDFNIANDAGLSSYLSESTSLESIIKHSGIDNFDIILSGPEPPNPVELLESPIMSEFITKLKNIYDYIIIDTAP